MKFAHSALAGLCLALGLLAPPAAPAQVVPPAPPAGPSFQAMDANKDGRLSLEEVLRYAKKQSAQVRGFRVADVDTNGDGVLTPEELKKAGVTGLEHFEAINVKDLDIRGDGYVSREDLDEYFRRKHREAYARADADGDGKVHLTDFALYRFSVKD